MAIQLIHYPDPVLRRRASPVQAIDDTVRNRIQEMFTILYTERGVGLAAPQVGWSVRLFIANVTGEPDPAQERVYINPRILESEGEVREEEGCLSIPDVRASVTRSRHVRIRAQNLQGEVVEEDLLDLPARVFQHEIDHLDGILFISRLSMTDRFRVNRALKKLEKDHAERATAVRAR